MKKAVFIGGASLIILGCALIFGSYHLFNHYSLSGSKDFAAAGEWRFPSSLLELSQGDRVTISVSVGGAGVADLYVINTAGRQILIHVDTANLTGSATSFTYDVSASDSYCYLSDVKSVSTHNGFSVTLAIEVLRITQNRPFLLTGVISLAVGVVAVVLAKQKHGFQEPQP